MSQRITEISESKTRERFDSFDDDRTIPITSPSPVTYSSSDSKDKPLTSRLSMTVDLNLSLARAETKQSARYDQFADTTLQEKTIIVVFDLPDGSQGEGCFKLGQTVEVLKSFVENEYGIPMSKQVLFFDEKIMMDPLSLLDYPEAKGETEIYVRVEGPLPNESKK
mmetsp:Transcript_14376/g.13000  ORF Transcript_14376/g.13000 Transcript_14376/m.13000 type:complete len:166 (-) Transcript_14376:40-537(-)